MKSRNRSRRMKTRGSNKYYKYILKIAATRNVRLKQMYFPIKMQTCQPLKKPKHQLTTSGETRWGGGRVTEVRGRVRGSQVEAWRQGILGSAFPAVYGILLVGICYGSPLEYSCSQNFPNCERFTRTQFTNLTLAEYWSMTQFHNLTSNRPNDQCDDRILVH